MLLQEQSSSWTYAFCKGEKKKKCYYQPLRPTQRKLLKARQFVAICWEDRVDTNKKSKNLFVFPRREETYGTAECRIVE